MTLFKSKTLKTALAGYFGFCLLAYSVSWAEMTQVSNSQMSSHKDKANSAIKTYQTRLKSELKEAIRNGGPKAAISICSEKASQIAQETSEEFGLSIGRTSLKLRNPTNKADDWELAMLNQFKVRKKQGVSLASMEASYQDDTIFRYMKAIPMNGMCANCHGTNVNPKLYKHIKEYYPDDQAIGLKPGDTRVAFTVSIPIRYTKE